MIRCSDCKYFDRCFPVLKWFFSHLCRQGQKKMVRASKVSADTVVPTLADDEEKGEYDTKLTPP